MVTLFNQDRLLNCVIMAPCVSDLRAAQSWFTIPLVDLEVLLLFLGATSVDILIILLSFGSDGAGNTVGEAEYKDGCLKRHSLPAHASLCLSIQRLCK